MALRAVMRIAWQVPNPISRANPDEDDRYPFAVLTPANGDGGDPGDGDGGDPGDGDGGDPGDG